MELITPEFDRFDELAGRFSRVPLVATLICDEITPLSAFARLQADSQRAFLLESVVGGENVARYSFLGADPAWTFEALRNQVRVVNRGTGQSEQQQSGDPLGALEKHLGRYRTPIMPGLPRFLGGAVGYAGYDTVRYYERLPDAPSDDRGLPDLLFDVYETMVIFDHVGKVVRVVAFAESPEDADRARRRRAYARAAERIESLIERLDWPYTLQAGRVSLPAAPLERYTSNFTPAQFEQVVARCQEYIRAGDVIQVAPSQRLLVETSAEPLNIYRALRVINPSPFMFYLKSPSVTLVGASPEILCRVEQGRVITRPLAGTRSRGTTPEEDRRLREELLADPKEQAQHVLLVDLGRNDVGRVARPGTVQISDLMTVEHYSHVMHLSSTVGGDLAEGRTALDALRAALPVGAATGAPKLRAMQIIDQCEPTRRGPYGGGVGYIDFAGNMDTCVGLRSVVIQPARDGEYRAYVQVGTGVVADSVPQHGHQETLNKASGLLSAIRVAEEQLAG
jgi:anthranilate synthase component 1